jgi:serine/threonine protein kinase/WD40 repeat protein
MNAQFSGKYELLDQLAEEFAERFRRGERPALSEFTDRHPDLAADIRELFPAMVEMERADSTCEPTTSPLKQVGDYHIVRELGRGGMGIVYEAEQSSLGRRVALKVLSQHVGGDNETLERFKREARSAARLHHTNIVPVFDVGQDGGICYYAMQYITGEGLDQVIGELRRLRSESNKDFAGGGHQPSGERTSAKAAASREANPSCSPKATKALLGGILVGGKPAASTSAPEDPYKGYESPNSAVSSGITSSPILSGQTELFAAESNHRHYFESVARIGRQVASALAHAHERGIVHRDVKPSNLLLDSSGIVWVTDFGLAKTEEDSLTRTGDILGTIRYMSPERFQGRCDPRADIYALGMSLYELLVLRPAFECRDRVTLISEISTEEPARPRAIDPRIPRDLETIVLKAIAKDPERRYQTANEMGQDLRRFIEGEPIKALRTGLLGRARLWSRRHPAMAGLYLVLLICGMASAAAAFYLNALLNAKLMAEVHANEKLWESYLAQAQATRMTHQPGQRFKALQAIKSAMNLQLPQGRSLDELRTEAIAALCLPDLEVDKEWIGYPTGSSAFAIDPSFEKYARADKQGDVSVRRVADDAELFHLSGSGKCADYGGLVFSPDGRFLRVRLAARTRESLWCLDGNSPVCIQTYDACSADFSPDSTRLAVSSTDGTVHVFEIETGQHLKAIPTPMAEAALFWNPVRANEIIMADARSWRILNPNSGELGPAIALPPGVITTNEALRWHPEGGSLALTCRDKSILLWDAQKQQSLLPSLHGHRASGIIFSFNHAGDLLLSSDWSGLWRLWDSRTGQQLLSLPADGHTLQFSPDDRRLAAHIGNEKVHLFKVETGREFQTLVRPGLTRSDGYYDFTTAVLLRKGRLLAIQVSGGIILIDLVRLEELAVLPFPGEAPLAYEPSDDSLLTVGQKGLLRWPIHTSADNDTCLSFGPPQQLDRLAGINSRSDDGSIMAASSGRNVLIWKFKENRKLKVPGWHSYVNHCQVSPDGRWVANGSLELMQDGGARVMDATTGNMVAKLPVAGFCWIRFSPDNKWLVTSGGGFRIWEVGTWHEGPPLGGSREIGADCVFSPDSKLLALDDATLGLVSLVDPKNGREVARLTVPVQSRLYPKCFTPDGDKLICIGRDSRALHIFDLRRIRAGLRELGLDWNGDEFDAGASVDTAIVRPKPLTVYVKMGNYSALPEGTRIPLQAAENQ